MRVAMMHRQLAAGGTEADLQRLAEGLASRGHDVHVFCTRANASLRGVVVRHVPIVRAGRAARVISFALLAPRVVAREPWDVVMGFGRTIRQDVARIGGGTHLGYLETMRRTGRWTRGWGPYHRAVLWIERRQFARAGHRRILAVSRRVAAEIAHDYPVVPAVIAVIYNGVDTDRFHPRLRATLGRRFRAEVGCTDDDRLCVAIGSGFERKGFDLLLDAWSAGSPAGARLAIAGGDERIARYRHRAAGIPSLGAGAILGVRADVPAVLAGADVLCAPSRQEAFGNVVLEACASGVPVVTSASVGAAELLEGSLRDLVIARSDDVDGLRAALTRALGPHHDTYRSVARSLAESRPWSRHVTEVEALLEEVRGG